MTDETKQKLSQLYALRAGLSVISQGYDIITAEEETKNEAEEDIKNHNTSIEVIEKSREKELLAKRDYWHVPKFNLAYFFGAMFATVVLTLVGCYIACLIMQIYPGYFLSFIPHWGEELNLLGDIASLACTILALAGMAIGGYLVLVPIFYILADICQSFSKNISAKIRYRKAAPKINIEYDSQAEVFREYIETDEAIISKCNAKIKANTSIYGDYAVALARQFAPVLNLADWKNTDLIIFYMQTGRADTMKEALQQADRQRQTDSIINEVRNATRAIVSEINSGFAALGQAMVSCFSVLSSQMSSTHARTLNAMGQIQSQNAELISQARLNNALQAKANLTSDKLCNDLSYIKDKAALTF